MRVVTIARKPCSESSTTANVVKHEAGALNIGASRVGTEKVRIGHNQGDSFSQSYKEKGTQPTRTHYTEVTGRWPPNVLLLHGDSCEIIGERKVKTGTAHRQKGGGRTLFSETVKPAMVNMSYGDADGNETVPQWSCEEGCAVAALDKDQVWSSDSGGASRFFRQFGGSSSELE
jgi:hypothetical protein